jgi:hypothetical protein
VSPTGYEVAAMKNTSLSTSLILFSLVSCMHVWGHRPIKAEEPPDRYQRALHIDRPDVSQVYYGVLEVERPQVWFRFKGGENQEIYFSVGIPFIERLTNYRPAIALIGPGLEHSCIDPEQLPFEIPNNNGVAIYTSDGEPRFFHEHVTGTDSWILIEETQTLPRSGTYYLVAYTQKDPRSGDKLWLTMGRKERFTLRDLFSLGRWKREIRTFHEIR